MTDGTGQVETRTEYLPYGETWFQEGDEKNSPKYNSQELDKETGYYYYNARHYDPETGRFVTADNVIDGEYSTQGWNRYMYCHGNPVKYMDPTGHETQVVSGAPSRGPAVSSGDGHYAINIPGGSPNAGVAVANQLQPAKSSVTSRTQPGGTTGGPGTILSGIENGRTSGGGGGSSSRSSSLHVRNLINAQDLTRNNPNYRMGGGGPFNMPDLSKTWCQQSTMDIIDATGADLSKFIGCRDRYRTNGHQMVDAMNEQVNNGNLTIASSDQAIQFANQGYTVVAGGNGHVATVRPGGANPSNPIVSNVGVKNQLWDVDTAFDGGNAVKYYYNPGQSFNFDSSKLNKSWGY